METIKLNEKQLREAIENVIIENCQEEGFFGGIKGAAKGLGNALSGEWNKLKRGAMNTGLGNEYNGQSFKDRMNAAKKEISGGFKSGDKQQELDRAYSAVQAIADKSILGEKGAQAAQTLMRCIQQSKLASNGGVKTAHNKRYGTPSKSGQQNVQRMVAESVIENCVKDAIREALKKN